MKYPLKYLLWIGFAAMLLAGCEEDVAGPPGLEEPFTLYGILNPRLETQELLVAPVEDLLAPRDSAIDALVTSTDLATGDERMWRLGIEPNATGQIDHIFRTDFRPHFGSRHRIEVARSDGAASSVEVDIPGRVQIEAEDDGTRHVELLVSGQEFQILRAALTFDVRFYHTSFPAADLCAASNPLGSYTIPLTPVESEAGDARRFEINLDLINETMRGNYQSEFYPDEFSGFENPVFDGLALMQMELEVTIGGLSWDPPGDVLDANVLALPGVLSNTTNGFGFVGGGYNQEALVWPTREALEDTWFFDRLMRPSENASCTDYCACGWN
jgi:hypothetical protein